jgi:cold shock protein
MYHGIIKFFNEVKGFGFIIPGLGGKDIFVYNSGLKEKVHQNDKVSYDLNTTVKGEIAVNVKQLR